MQPNRKKERFLLPGNSGKYFGKDPFLNMENNAKENGAMNIHFIGVGGVSMSTLAAVSAKGGMTVTGSDRAPSAVTERLEESGIRVFCPQSAENLDKAGRIDRVVYTAAIPEDNPELKEARRRGIPCMRRSEYLGQLMKQYSVRIGVSGTHGKSSTTGMLAHLFLEAGNNPTVACGAELCELHSAYRLGGREQFVYEACEYKDAFLDFFPTVAVMLNMEMDHVDYYHSMEQMERSYISSAKDAKAVVLNGDDPHLRSVAERLKGVWVVKVGVNSFDCDYRAADIQMKGGFASFDFYKENEKLGPDLSRSARQTSGIQRSVRRCDGSSLRTVAKGDRKGDRVRLRGFSAVLNIRVSIRGQRSTTTMPITPPRLPQPCARQRKCFRRGEGCSAFFSLIPIPEPPGFLRISWRRCLCATGCI